MAKTTCSGYNKTVAHAFPIGGPEAARLVAEQSGKLCPVELYHTQSDQKRLFLGSEIIAPYVHTPVASVSDLTGVYLRTSRGVWRGDSVFVSGDGCTYTVVTGYGTGAVWRRDGTSAVQKYAGVIVQPTISTGYLSIGVSGDGLYGLYSVDQPSILQQYTFTGGNFALTDNVINYLLATNTGDGAKLTVSTNRNDIEGNFRTVIPIVTLPVDNGEIHQMSWAEGGHAMPEKHGNFFINNFRFVRDGLAGGLMLGEASDRAVTLTAGKVWYGGISSINLDAFDSRSGSNFWLYEDRGTGWVRYLTGQYNNTSYQSTSGFAPLQNANRYAVNWIYRTVGDDVRCLSVLGTADYDLASAEAAGVPARLPPIIPAHAILVGKIVAAKNATGAYKIYSAFDTAFGGGGGGVSDHSQLSNLQGGTAGEYYHSSSSQYSTWSKITESGGLPLWNGSGWPGGGSNTGINSVNVYNTPTGYLTSTNTQGAINQLYTGKQDVLTNSSSLAKITTSSSGCPLWDGGSWPISISFIESGQYTIATGCGVCDGEKWIQLNSNSNLIENSKYISFPNLIHQLPNAISGEELFLSCSDSGNFLLKQNPNDQIKINNILTPSGSGWGVLCNKISLACSSNNIWNITSSDKCGLGHVSLPIQQTWAWYRGEDYNSSGKWIDRGPETYDFIKFTNTAPIKNIGPVFSGQILVGAARRSPESHTALIVLKSFSTNAMGVLSRSAGGSATASGPYLLINYPSSNSFCPAVGYGSITDGWHVGTVGGLLGSSLQSLLWSFDSSTINFIGNHYINNTGVSWSTSYGSQQQNIGLYQYATFLGGDPLGDNGLFYGEITDLIVWPTVLNSGERNLAIEYFRNLRGL